MADENPTPSDENTPDESAESGRFAAYDTTYERFVGGVHDTKTAATEAAKAAGVSGKRLEIRGV